MYTFPGKYGKQLHTTLFKKNKPYYIRNAFFGYAKYVDTFSIICKTKSPLCIFTFRRYTLINDLYVRVERLSSFAISTFPLG